MTGPGEQAKGPTPIWRIALRDLAFDWRLSGVAALGVAVALAPLVILYGLKLGVVDTLRAALASDPRNLELTLRGGGAARFDADWFAALAAQPETGFLSPMTRGTVAAILLRNPADPEAEPVEVSLLPTGPGDPVLARAGLAPPEGEAVVLSALAAETLRIAGDAVPATAQAIVTRTDGSRREAVRLEVAVAGVLPAEAASRALAYVPLHLIVAAEDYREWQRVERYGWPGNDPLDDSFADFRLYAKGLDEVEPLRLKLRAQGLEIESAADRIAQVRRIDADLDLVFRALLGLTLAGFSAAVALNQLANVARKRQTLAVLRLIGYRGASLMLFPVLQGAALATLGALAALGLFAAMDPMLGALFADVVQTRGSLLRLPAADVLRIVAGAAALAALASLFAARQAFLVAPSRELRHV
ncbi:MAG: FtsX-like permease family protein [Rubrimonas sp.]|uniref:FtsX-like permease family protein n=1 Tax=Rubrimonas sp. TaxID=2036015 RepID=UPI002FDD5492